MSSAPADNWPRKPRPMPRPSDTIFARARPSRESPPGQKGEEARNNKIIEEDWT